MKITFSENSWKDYICWQEENDARLEKVNELLADIVKSPYSGKGRPEKLLGKLSNYWARRIDSDHRLVYQVTDGEIFVVACRFHYIYE